MVQPGRTDKKSNFAPPIGAAKEKLLQADVEALEKLSRSLQAVTGITFGTGAVKLGEQSINITVLGTNEKITEILNVTVQTGQFFSKEDSDAGRRVIVVGYNVAKKVIGDEQPLGKLVKLNESEYRVVGVVTRSGQSLGFNMDDMVFIPVRAAMRLFNEDKLFGLRAKAKARVSVDDAVAEITDILKRRHNGQEDFTVVTQVSMLESMNTIMGMLTYVLAGIAMISMIVGGIGIMNIMLVSVTERTREIGIRRAVGAKRADVLRQFLVEAISLSLLGGMIGLVGSVSVTYIVYLAIPKFDMRAPVWVLLPAFGLSVGTGVLFGVWPARKAARLATIDALRYE
jgi:putative ABC transport system permease protein